MHRLIALYHQPTNPQAFRDHLNNVHLPIVARFPGLRALRVGYDLALDQGESPYFAIVECDFDDVASLREALSSPERPFRKGLSG
jgi:uncharacterized protein (TIGR02118 family)